jgi:hypothetical protein
MIIKEATLHPILPSVEKKDRLSLDDDWNDARQQQKGIPGRSSRESYQESSLLVIFIFGLAGLIMLGISKPFRGSEHADNSPQKSQDSVALRAVNSENARISRLSPRVSKNYLKTTALWINSCGCEVLRCSTLSVVEDIERIRREYLERLSY